MDTNSKFCVFYVKQIVFCPKHDIVISCFTETQFSDVVLSLKIYIFEFTFYTDVVFCYDLQNFKIFFVT